MSAFESAQDAVNRKLDSCDNQIETWKADHQLAMIVFDCEHLVGDIVESFDSMEQLDIGYAEFVRKNPALYNGEFDDKIKLLCGKFLSLAEDVSSFVVSVCKAKGYEVKNEAELLDRITRAKNSQVNGFDLHAITRTKLIAPTFEQLTAVCRPLSEWPAED